MKTFSAFCTRDRERACGHWDVGQPLLELKGLEIRAALQSRQCSAQGCTQKWQGWKQSRASECLRPYILLRTTLPTRQGEGTGCDGGRQRRKSQTLSLLGRKLSWFAELACSLYTVPSKRSVKPAFRALIPPGIRNVTTDAEVIFVLSLQWGSRASANRMPLSSLLAINTNKNHSSL